MALPGSKLCDAMSKRSGEKCKAPAVRGNSKCRIHGGKSTGPKEPAKNPGSTNFGIYAKYLRPHERDMQFELGNVDAELTMVRIQLTRTIEAEAKWEEAQAKGEDVAETNMDLVETVREDGDRVVGEQVIPVSSTRKVRRRPDFDTIKSRWLARIESLEKTRKELVGDGGDTTLQEKAAKFRAFMSELDDTVPEVDDDASGS